jgi:hypothetical protein
MRKLHSLTARWWQMVLTYDLGVSMNSLNEGVIVKRINRKLADSGEELKLCPYQGYDYEELGRYYIVNRFNSVTAKHIDLDKLAQELAV